ncbi:MAG TPA: CGNR zinc finger domain-containing protein [Geodermatophilus sp.]|nr:CGNR zinc finger domain-containing protein [Geodermatophilus sp.]
MDYDTYGSSAVELAIDLANADRAGDPDWAARFLRSHHDWFSADTSLELSPAEAVEAARTADLVRAVAVAGSQAEVIERLNALLALARPRPYATDHDGELHLHYARPEAPVLEQLTTTVAMGLSQVVAQHGWQRLGVCSAEGCDNVYVDTSRNASRRYCSNTCASRSTVAAYRARRKA